MLKLSRFIVESRKFAVALVVALTALSIYGITQLRFDDDPRNVLKTNDRANEALEAVYRKFGTDDQTIVVVLEADDFFTPQRIAALREYATKLRARPEVRSVYSFLDVDRPGPLKLQLPLVAPEEQNPEAFERARQFALNNSLIRGQLLSDDGRTALMLASVNDAGVSMRAMGELVYFVRMSGENALSGLGIDIRLTGVPVIREELIRTIQTETLVFNALAALACTVTTILILRHFGASATALVGPLGGALWMLGFMGLAGLPINVLTCVVPTLVTTIGLSDSIHLVNDMRARLAVATDRTEAAVQSLYHVGSACGITSLTTAVGFASLMITNSPSIRLFGLVCAIGSIVVFLTSAVLVPVVGVWLLTPASPQTDSAASRWITSMTSHIVDFSLRNRRILSYGAVVLLAACCWLGTQIQPNSQLTENLVKGSESAAAMADCDARFGGVMFANIIVTLPESMPLSDPAAERMLREAERVLMTDGQITRSPISMLNVVDGVPNLGRDWSERVAYLTSTPRRSLQRFYNAEDRAALVAAHVPAVGSRAMAPVTKRLQAGVDRLRQEFPSAKFALSGMSVIGTSTMDRMIRELGNSLGLEAVIICLLAATAFRSLRLGVISILPNAFPLSLVAAALYLTDSPLQLSNVIVFNICLGLAVDDTVHVLTRLRHQRSDDPEAELRDAFLAVGPSVATTSLILVIGFGVSSLSRLPAISTFGRLACLTIAASFFAELILLPAIISQWGAAAVAKRRKPREPATTS